METISFERYLKRRRLKKNSIAMYVSHVEMFKDWLFKRQKKRLENANENDINLWFPNIKKTRKSYPTILVGLKHYYKHKNNHNMVKKIEEIQSEITTPKSTLKHSIRWSDFRKAISEAEKNNIEVRNRALLELLWSEMYYEDILKLRWCDIDFEKKIVTSSKEKKTYHVTKEAWYALEKLNRPQEMDDAKQLFSMRYNNLQKITKQYFKDMQTPTEFKNSCEADLTSVGKTIRFATESKKKTSEKENQIKKSRDLAQEQRFRSELKKSKGKKSSKNYLNGISSERSPTK